MSRKGFKPAPGFGQKQKDDGAGGIETMVKAGRKSGQLNLSNKNLEEVPSCVWRINLDAPEEGKTVALDVNPDDRWWEQTDLVKLILASNLLVALSEDIKELIALSVLDVHDNRLTSLPEALGGLANLTRLNLSHNSLTSLPEHLGNLQNLTTLQVDHNKLTELSDNILGKLTKLENFEISNNNLTSLPPGIGNLNKITKLAITNNKLTTVPDEIGNLQNLRHLDLTHNAMTALPEGLGNLSKLEQMYLRHNRLTDLPLLKKCSALMEIQLGNNQIKEMSADQLQYLTKITILDLRDNKIATIPDEIGLLTGLQRLDVTNNDLTGLPYILGTLDNLKSIVLDGNPMKTIRRDIVQRGTNEIKKYLVSRMPTDAPAPLSRTSSSTSQAGDVSQNNNEKEEAKVDVNDAMQFKKLDYSGRDATEIPDSVWEVGTKGSVATLNISKNKLTQLPSTMMVLCSTLKELNMSQNRLSSLHSDISLYLQLTFLDLRNNNLTDLPQEMTSLQNLREVVLGFNRLSKVPTVLYELQKLEIIIANDNKIDAIDAPGILKLPVLATLDLQNNNIGRVPPEIATSASLRALQLSGNMFKIPRADIISKGSAAVLDYLKTRIPQ